MGLTGRPSLSTTFRRRRHAPPDGDALRETVRFLVWGATPFIFFYPFALHRATLRLRGILSRGAGTSTTSFCVGGSPCEGMRDGCLGGLTADLMRRPLSPTLFLRALVPRVAAPRQDLCRHAWLRGACVRVLLLGGGRL